MKKKIHHVICQAIKKKGRRGRINYEEKERFIQDKMSHQMGMEDGLALTDVEEAWWITKWTGKKKYM